jgi:hypothetical protein
MTAESKLSAVSQSEKDRHLTLNRMKEYMKQQELEAGKKEGDVLGLNMRDKDEGDLFGIRAIEAGFYGGVPQSQPASLAGSPAGSRSASPAPGYHHGTYCNVSLC